MKCPYCNNAWCWICGDNCSYAHYLPFNPFGCPGLLSNPSLLLSYLSYSESLWEKKRLNLYDLKFFAFTLGDALVNNILIFYWSFLCL